MSIPTDDNPQAPGTGYGGSAPNIGAGFSIPVTGIVDINSVPGAGSMATFVSAEARWQRLTVTCASAAGKPSNPMAQADATGLSLSRVGDGANKIAALACIIPKATADSVGGTVAANYSMKVQLHLLANPSSTVRTVDTNSLTNETVYAGFPTIPLKYRPDATTAPSVTFPFVFTLPIANHVPSDSAVYSSVLTFDQPMDLLGASQIIAAIEDAPDNATIASKAQVYGWFVN